MLSLLLFNQACLMLLTPLIRNWIQLCTSQCVFGYNIVNSMRGMKDALQFIYCKLFKIALAATLHISKAGNSILRSSRVTKQYLFVLSGS